MIAFLPQFQRREPAAICPQPALLVQVMLPQFSTRDGETVGLLSQADPRIPNGVARAADAVEVQQV